MQFLVLQHYWGKMPSRGFFFSFYFLNVTVKLGWYFRLVFFESSFANACRWNTPRRPVWGRSCSWRVLSNLGEKSAVLKLYAWSSFVGLSIEKLMFDVICESCNLRVTARYMPNFINRSSVTINLASIHLHWPFPAPAFYQCSEHWAWKCYDFFQVFIFIMLCTCRVHHPEHWFPSVVVNGALIFGWLLGPLSILLANAVRFGVPSRKWVSHRPVMSSRKNDPKISQMLQMVDLCSPSIVFITVRFWLLMVLGCRRYAGDPTSSSHFMWRVIRNTLLNCDSCPQVRFNPSTSIGRLHPSQLLASWQFAGSLHVFQVAQSNTPLIMRRPAETLETSTVQTPDSDYLWAARLLRMIVAWFVWYLINWFILIRCKLIWTSDFLLHSDTKVPMPMIRCDPTALGWKPQVSSSSSGATTADLFIVKELPMISMFPRAFVGFNMIP